jgi:hypothetical protein
MLVSCAISEGIELPLTEWAGVGSVVAMDVMDVFMLAKGSALLGENCEGLCGVCGWKDMIALDADRMTTAGRREKAEMRFGTTIDGGWPPKLRPAMDTDFEFAVPLVFSMPSMGKRAVVGLLNRRRGLVWRQAGTARRQSLVPQSDERATFNFRDCAG